MMEGSEGRRRDWLEERDREKEKEAMGMMMRGCMVKSNLKRRGIIRNGNSG